MVKFTFGIAPMPKSVHSKLRRDRVPQSTAESQAPPQPSGLQKEQVYGIAESLARHIGFKVGGDIIAATEKLGGRILVHDYWVEGSEDAESLFVHSDSNFDIFVPSHTSILRDRFTIAHELGHYVLHYLWPRSQGNCLTKMRATRYGSDRTEWEANWFASGFLIPEQSFRKSFEQHRGKLALVAADFEVSVRAAHIRAKALQLTAQGD